MLRTKYVYILQFADMHVPAATPHQCSLVHIHMCGWVVFVHVSLLSPSTRGTTQHNQHMWTCAERHRARVLKRPQGK